MFCHNWIEIFLELNYCLRDYVYRHPRNKVRKAKAEEQKFFRLVKCALKLAQKIHALE